MKDTLNTKSNSTDTLPNLETPLHNLEEISTSPQIPSEPSNTKWLIIGGLILVALIGGLWGITQRTTYKLQQPTLQPTTKPAINPTLPRSKALGVITKVVTAKDISPTTGEAVNPTSAFLQTDKNIFLVLSLKNPKVGTKFEFVRYLNKVYLDKGSLPVTKATTDNISFVWSLKKASATHQVGRYRVKVYTSGVFEKEIYYTVQ